MVGGTITRVVHPKRQLTHQDVLTLRRDLAGASADRVVVLDLRQTQDTTTAALAGLILLRRERIKAGGDLLLIGLSGKALYLYELLRLAKILPRRPCVHPRRVRQLRDGRADVNPANIGEYRPVHNRQTINV